MTSNLWHIGLSSWVIGDGTYWDFEVGQIAEFAVRFWLPPGSNSRQSDEEVGVKHTGGAMYDAVADVVLKTDSLTVLDVGFLAYDHFPGSGSDLLKENARVSTPIGLTVDEFGYFEVTDGPGLVYSWKILSILMETTPWKEEVNSGARIRRRDPDRKSYREVERTGEGTEGADASYVFLCDLLPVPPKRTSITARNWNSEKAADS